MSATQVEFRSGDALCRGHHFVAKGDASAPRPLVVMAPGMGSTIDSGGHLAIAQRLADEGFEVLAFDYRGWGASDGSPRQTINIRKQRADFQAAVRFAAAFPGVDAKRIVVWGHSLGGGNALDVNAIDPMVAASISVFPAINGAAVAKASPRPQGEARKQNGSMLVKDAIAQLTRRPRVYVSLVATPEEPGYALIPGAYEQAVSDAGPTWRNQINAAYGLEILRRRTEKLPRTITKPCLIQVGDQDRWVPRALATDFGHSIGATTRNYPCDHHGLWPQEDTFEAIVTDQIAFIRSL